MTREGGAARWTRHENFTLSEEYRNPEPPLPASITQSRSGGDPVHLQWASTSYLPSLRRDVVVPVGLQESGDISRTRAVGRARRRISRQNPVGAIARVLLANSITRVLIVQESWHAGGEIVI